jgi:hypothetical protein
MGVDLSKIAASAIEAALDDGEDTRPERKRGSTVKAVAAGAALAVAAKAATSKRTKLMSKLVPTPSLDGLRDIPGRVRDRLADSGWLGDEADVEPEGVAPLDEVAEEPLEDEEPIDEDEDEEDFDEEQGDDEPVDEEEEDFDEEEGDDEPVDEEDEDFDEDEEEELDDEKEDEDFDEEDEEEDSPPELAIDSDDDEDIDPVTRPPKPPKATSRR